MVFVALLRGINVGGHNSIDMKQLKQTFLGAGMTHVSTYINSGNVVFVCHDLEKHEIQHKLENAIRNVNTFRKIDELIQKTKNDA